MACSSPLSFAWAGLLSGALLLLAGCGGGSIAPTHAAPAALTGRVRGGQQPVAGAAIQLWAAGTSGYGTGAVPLLQTAVVTDAGGNFSITGTYQCPSAASQVYLTATGGNPGLAAGTVNPALALMAVLGPCGQFGTGYTLDPNSRITVNEVTTVAAVYALRAFMTAHATLVGASATNAVGLANAFAKVANLVDPATGLARTATPAGNGTVPQTELNTLADILAPCVNSDGTGTACSALFGAAATAAYGTPADTIQAAWAIASSPAHNVPALVGLVNSTAPFQPTLATVPADLTVMVRYAGGGLLTANFSSVNTLAIDTAGALWALANVSGTTTSVLKFANDGSLLSPAPGYSGGGLAGATGLGIDPDGSVWVPGSTNRNVVKLSQSGALLSGANGYTGLGLSRPGAVALDGSGSAWIADAGSQALIKLGPAGAVLSGAAGYAAPVGSGAIAIDTGGNVWGPTGGNALFKLSPGGSALSPASGYPTASVNPLLVNFDRNGNAWTNSIRNDILAAEMSATGTLLSPFLGYMPCTPAYVFGASGTFCLWSNGQPFALDGAGHVWTNSDHAVIVFGSGGTTQIYTGIAEMSNSGVVLSPTTIGYATPVDSFGIAVDQSGDVWVLGDGVVTTLLELVGAGTPVVQPFSVGVRDGTLGQRP